MDDRDRIGNQEIIVYASAARTATPTAFELPLNQFWRGIVLTIDATASAATPSMVLTVEYRDPASLAWEILVSATAVTTTSRNTVYLYPGGDITAPGAVTDVAPVALPYRCRIVCTHADADSITYSVGGCLLI